MHAWQGRPIRLFSHITRSVSEAENVNGKMGRLDDIQIPDPTKTPSQPSCIMRAASAGVATPPAAKLDIPLAEILE